MPDDLRRVVSGPQGRGYEVIGVAKDWKLGTGSVLLDAAAFLWGIVRRARGREWVVTVRPLDTRSDPVLTRLVMTRGEAVSSVTKLDETCRGGRKRSALMTGRETHIHNSSAEPPISGIVPDRHVTFRYFENRIVDHWRPTI